MTASSFAATHRCKLTWTRDQLTRYIMCGTFTVRGQMYDFESIERRLTEETHTFDLRALAPSRECHLFMLVIEG